MLEARAASAELEDVDSVSIASRQLSYVSTGAVPALEDGSAEDDNGEWEIF